MTSAIAVALLLVGQVSGISSLKVQAPVGDSPGLAYTVEVQGFSDLSDADLNEARVLIQKMRRAGGPGSPKGGFVLGGGELSLTHRQGELAYFEQRSGPKVLLQSGEVRDTGKGIQLLWRMYIMSTSKVSLWFDEEADVRYMNHIIEVVQQYMERTHHGGNLISLDAETTRVGSFRIVHLTCHGSE